MESSQQWDATQLRRYDFALEQIPRIYYKDPRIDELIAQNVNSLTH